MIREGKFVLSHRPYAVDLASFHTIDPNNGDGLTAEPSEWTWARIDAVWFRRRGTGYGALKRMVTVACVGHLRDLQRPPPVDAADFLARHDDGRYGGDCEGRWDGERYWGSQLPDIIEQHLELLRPMLAAYPAVPAAYDGWWRF
jgi:hypothetical protein